MNRNSNGTPRTVRHPAYREAFEKLDMALAENTSSGNSEKIRLLREACFADADEFVRAGELQLPKYNP